MFDLAALVRIGHPEGMRVTVVLAQAMPGKQGGQSIGAEQTLGAAHRGNAQGFARAYSVFDARERLAVESEARSGDGRIRPDDRRLADDLRRGGPERVQRSAVAYSPCTGRRAPAASSFPERNAR